MTLFFGLGRNVVYGLNSITRRYSSLNNSVTSSPNNSTTPSEQASFETKASYPLTKSKKILCVWAKKYPSVKEIPDKIPLETWSKVRSIIRIKVANITMLLVLVGCVAMIVSGKRARERGETISDRNLEWHKRYTKGDEEEIKNIGVFGK
ncbi:UPF0389 protein GA21628 isoform X3 [Daktulosphaira vitifoliae]|uniref:UPF0389 protein GA21628 isoform X3 n=1 Tax=Daktulosphaira vitifoliae TaxID=58002 RepID=UPI0021AA5E77|nr:UPF0389 protein GA21628 isoform X3 [Daktulosphaira vitifoliae]